MSGSKPAAAAAAAAGAGSGSKRKPDGKSKARHKKQKPSGAEEEVVRLKAELAAAQVLIKNLKEVRTNVTTYIRDCWRQVDLSEPLGMSDVCQSCFKVGGEDKRPALCEHCDRCKLPAMCCEEVECKHSVYMTAYAAAKANGADDESADDAAIDARDAAVAAAVVADAAV